LEINAPRTCHFALRTLLLPTKNQSFLYSTKKLRSIEYLEKIRQQLAVNYPSVKLDTLAAWSERYTVTTHKKGTLLARVGQQHHKLYFVLEGSLKAYYSNEDKRIIDWFAFKNDFITTSTSYFTDEPSLHNIEAMEDCTLIETSKDGVESMCMEYHDFEHLFRIVLSRVIVQYRHRMFSLQFKTVKQRYQSLIEQFPTIEQTVPLGDIASFLGITRETLSRIRAAKA